METDSKGQLGGLDTNDTERKHYADRSASWKCPTCAKSNEEILKECAEAAKEKEAAEGDEQSKVDETVPSELKIGFKPDDAETSPEKQEQQATTADPIQREAEMHHPARPRQSFHQPTAPTAPGALENSPAVVTPAPRNIPLAAPIQREPEIYPRARPAQGVPQPTGTVSSSRSAEAIANQQTIQAAAALQATRARQQQMSNDSELVWIDRAIAGVVVCLVFMLTKVFLGL
jgi:ubiquitin-conjugating enzyme E2 J1